MFSWMEASKGEKLRQRNMLQPDCCHNLERVPMFCVETAIKLMYFSSLCYSFEVGRWTPLLAHMHTFHKA